jgi:hypothetical protein
MRCGCGNEEKESKNWTEGEERRCRMCREDNETTSTCGADALNEREGGKGAGRNTEQRWRKRMGRREGKGWGIEKKMLYLVFVRIVISV